MSQFQEKQRMERKKTWRKQDCEGAQKCDGENESELLSLLAVHFSLTVSFSPSQLCFHVSFPVVTFLVSLLYDSPLPETEYRSQLIYG